MKAILMSIKPKWVAKILNGDKTIEIRKRFTVDYVGWVYIYCTKGKPYITGIYNYEHKIVYGDIENKNHNINGKVVARFWCDKVEHIEYETCSRDISGWWKDNGKVFNHKDACLTYVEMFDYIGSGEGYAIHITKLEIFDKPKEISEFKRNRYHHYTMVGYTSLDPLTRAPQSYCYIEI